MKRWVGYGIFLVGLFLIAWGLSDWLHQIYLGEGVSPIRSVDSSPKPEPEEAKAPKEESGEIIYRDIPQRGERFADLIIPKLDIRLPIVEGTSEKELKKGIGHYRESVFPGEKDNAVLAGHRESAFRRIGQLKKGDRIIVETKKEGTFTFAVRKTWITDEDDRTVIVSHDEALLTLITCYPFDWIGAAPKRYIVQAELKEIER